MSVFVTLKEVCSAQDKNESFLIIEALNQKHNSSHGYKNSDGTRATATTRDSWHRPLSSLRHWPHFRWDRRLSSGLALMHQLIFSRSPRAVHGKETEGTRQFLRIALGTLSAQGVLGNRASSLFLWPHRPLGATGFQTERQYGCFSAEINAYWIQDGMTPRLTVAWPVTFREVCTLRTRREWQWPLWLPLFHGPLATEV